MRRKIAALFVWAAAALSAQQTYTITTMAGMAYVPPGGADGLGSAARFDAPHGVASDAAGNVYVADTYNYTIRKITPDGNVTTLAGSPQNLGSADGLGSAARFYQPFGVAVDAAGNVFVADTGYDTIRKITPDGNVTTYAGTARNQGSADGTGSAAQFSYPSGIGVDASGNVYVTDEVNGTIRKITPDQRVSTIAGTAGVTGFADGMGAAARFQNPSGVAVDAAGNLYIADRGNNVIRMMTPNGMVTTLAGLPGQLGTADGTGSGARFQNPTGVAVDAAGEVFVADTGNLTIRKIAAGGVVTTVAGLAQVAGFANGVGSAVLFDAPSGVAVDGAFNIYVADYGINQIRKGISTTPVITAQPQSLAVASGAAAAFSVAASGATTLSYQWYKNGSLISTATAASYTIASAQVSDTASYSVTVTNGAGSVTSSPANLAVSAPVSVAPSFTLQPASVTVASGSTAVLSAAASGTPAPTFQWYLGSTLLPNQTGSRLVISGATQAANAGTYTVKAINSTGTTTSNAATLTVATTSNPGRLIDISIISTIANSLTMGFIQTPIGASASEPVLIRAIGPALSAFGYTPSTYLPDPTLTVNKQSPSTVIGANTGWGTPSSNATAVQNADAVTGAFPLSDTTSKDSAIALNLPAVGGGYSAVVSGKSNDSGAALTEVYDATPTASYVDGVSPRLFNLSCITTIPASGSLTVGFVVGGTTAKTLLIRVSGPTLEALGFAGTMPDPQMSVQPLSNASDVLAANAGWGGDPAIAAAAAKLNTFAFTGTTSQDSAVLLTVANGTPTTVQVSSVSGTAGAVLIELYEVQ